MTDYSEYVREFKVTKPGATEPSVVGVQAEVDSEGNNIAESLGNKLDTPDTSTWDESGIYSLKKDGTWHMTENAVTAAAVNALTGLTISTSGNAATATNAENVTYKEITTATDLDTVEGEKGKGTWYYWTDSTAANITHAPVNAGAVMSVIPINRGSAGGYWSKQIVYPRYTSDVWIRHKTAANGAWGAWKKMAMTDDIPSGVPTLAGDNTFTGTNTFSQDINISNTNGQAQFVAQGKSGSITLASSNNGNSRGVWLTAHGTDTNGKWAFSADTNNNVTFNGNLNGTATSADILGSTGIANNTNLNTIKGSQRCVRWYNGNADSNTYLNIPSGLNNEFILGVYNSNNSDYCLQTIFSAVHGLWTRKCNNGTWTAWVKVMNHDGTFPVSITGNAATASKVTQTVGYGALVSRDSSGNLKYTNDYFNTVSDDNNGNMLAIKSTGVRRARVSMQSKNTTYNAYLRPQDNFTAEHEFTLPDKSGTLALTSDIPSTSNFVAKAGDTMTGGLTVGGTIEATAGNDGKARMYITSTLGNYGFLGEGSGDNTYNGIYAWGYGWVIKSRAGNNQFLGNASTANTASLATIASTANQLAVAGSTSTAVLTASLTGTYVDITSNIQTTGGNYRGVAVSYAKDADTVDGKHIIVGSTLGTAANTIYFIR